MSTLTPRSGAPRAAGGFAALRMARRLLVAGTAIVFALLIIYTELTIVMVAAVWSLTGVLGVGRTGLVALSLLLGALALWAAWHATRMVFEAERDRAGL